VAAGPALRRGLLFALALLAAGCAKSVDLSLLSSPSDAVVWEAGQKAVQKKDWASARQYFKRIVDAFPQSEHQPDARLAVANSYFEEGGTANYVLAASSYHEFLTLYPQHQRSDYAQFQAGESYFKQRNSPDRDQTQTIQALEEYSKLLDIYPESRYVEQTRGRIQECRQILARSHYLVGFFYQRGRQAWRSAIGRYETILNEYPDYEKLDEVLYHYAECLAAAGRYAEALPAIGRLQTQYPKSQFLGDAEKLRASFPPSAPTGPAKLPPAPTTAGAQASSPGQPPAAQKPETATPPPDPQHQDASQPPK
jgi:outer membrane assembly lipoprotein YfiO